MIVRSMFKIRAPGNLILPTTSRDECAHRDDEDLQSCCDVLLVTLSVYRQTS